MDRELAAAVQEFSEAKAAYDTARANLKRAEARWEAFRPADEERRARLVERSKEASARGQRVVVDARVLPEDEARARQTLQGAQEVFRNCEHRLDVARQERLLLYRERDLDPHRVDLSKRLQAAVQTLAAASLAAATATLTVAGLGDIGPQNNEIFRHAFFWAIGGLVGSLAYYVPILIAHISDVRFFIRAEKYEGQLAGRPTHLWVFGLGVATIAGQLLCWMLSIWNLVLLTNSIFFVVQTS